MTTPTVTPPPLPPSLPPHPPASVGAGGAARSAAPAARQDFPGWLPPMLVKELRQGLRTRGFVGSLVLVQAAMAMVLFWAFMGRAAGDESIQSTTSGFFWTGLVLMVLVLTPSRGMGALRTEIDGRSLDLLVLTRLSVTRIILGKWFSLLVQATLLVIAFLPYLVTRYFLGGVDLPSELGWIAFLLLGGAVLTAVALWVSTLPRFLRVLTPIAAVVGFQMLSVMLTIRSSTGGGAMEGPGLATLVWDLLLLMAFGLVQTVRALAPPAENHASATRWLVLLTLLPVPVLLLFNERDLATDQLVGAMVALGLVGALELARGGEPMAVQVRRPARRGWGWLWSAWRPLAWPGWPSAALFLALAGGLVVGLAGAGAWSAGGSHVPLWRLGWVLVLGWVALVFPAVLLSWVPQLQRGRALAYLLPHVLGGFVAAMVHSIDYFLLGVFGDLFKEITRMLPVAGFWLECLQLDQKRTLAEVSPGEVAMVLAVLLAVLWSGREYWQRIRALARTAVGAGATAGGRPAAGERV